MKADASAVHQRDPALPEGSTPLVCGPHQYRMTGRSGRVVTGRGSGGKLVESAAVLARAGLAGVVRITTAGGTGGGRDRGWRVQPRSAGGVRCRL
jgi:hypothetical protein